jgi:membrane-associated HD superfamily phosphohydrolase
MDEIPPVGHHTKSPAHYYGDVVRGLFLGAAIVMLFAGFTTATLPVSTGLTIVWIVILVLIAGLTNPVQRGVQWLNVIVSTIGLLVFGGTALSRYHSPTSVFTTGIFIAILTLIFLLALYFATRTLRAHILLHPAQPRHHN